MQTGNLAHLPVEKQGICRVKPAAIVQQCQPCTASSASDEQGRHYLILSIRECVSLLLSFSKAGSAVLAAKHDLVLSKQICQVALALSSESQGFHADLIIPGAKSKPAGTLYACVVRSIGCSQSYMFYIGRLLKSLNAHHHCCASFVSLPRSVSRCIKL